MVDVIVVGAGLAGLTCARRLQEIGHSFVILEASDTVSGRLRTDLMDGFQLDRGFQVLLTAYPECRRWLDYDELKLHRFARGVLIRFGGQFHRVADPRRDPIRGLTSMFGPIGLVADKWKLLRLISKLRSFPPEKLFEQPEGLTLDLLRWHGFSEVMIERFFRPLFSVFSLERDLLTSSRLFRFVFRMLSDGDVAVPEHGMQAIPEQLASRLPPDCIRFNARVVNVEPGRVTLQSGEVIKSNAVVVATEESEAARLLGWPPSTSARSVLCIYFAAPESPLNEPIVVLNAENDGPINHLAVMSDICSRFAPPGQSLISASVLGNPNNDDESLWQSAQRQLVDWFGERASSWRHLRTYRIPFALPDQTAPALDVPLRPVRIQPSLYVCGDHRDYGSMNGAMQSGWRAAQAVAEDIFAGQKTV